MGLEQTTFGEPEKNPIKKKPSGPKRSQSTYWVCKGNPHHVFEQKHGISETRIELMKCPHCGAGVKNKSSKSTYQYFLKKHGRMDEKKYRMDQIRKKKQKEQKDEKTRQEMPSPNV